MSFPKIEGYVVTEKLGSGSYSTVYKAYTKVGARSIVAIKCVDKARVKHSGAAIDNLITEIRLLKTLTHPHIVHMKHFTWDDSFASRQKIFFNEKIHNTEDKSTQVHVTCKCRRPSDQNKNKFSKPDNISQQKLKQYCIINTILF